VGGSVIIGGHKKKTEKVLLHLNRMYMPLKNYIDLETDFLESYWSQGKDILGVTHFGDLVPEVFWLDTAYETIVQELNEMRIVYKLGKLRKEESGLEELKNGILKNKARLRAQIEKEIIRRIEALRHYLRSPMRDPHVSLEEIFKPQKKNIIKDIRFIGNLFNVKPKKKKHKPAGI